MPYIYRPPALHLWLVGAANKWVPYLFSGLKDRTFILSVGYLLRLQIKFSIQWNAGTTIRLINTAEKHLCTNVHDARAIYLWYMYACTYIQLRFSQWLCNTKVSRLPQNSFVSRNILERLHKRLLQGSVIVGNSLIRKSSYSYRLVCHFLRWLINADFLASVPNAYAGRLMQSRRWYLVLVFGILS